MLVKRGNKFELYPHRVKCIQHGKEFEQWALPSKEWCTNFEKTWEHTEIIKFVKVELTDEQIKCFEEINQFNFPEGFRSFCEDYILNGKLPEGDNHPLNVLELKKEKEKQGVELSEREIQEIIQGQQISDLEIQLLELRGGN